MGFTTFCIHCQIGSHGGSLASTFVSWPGGLGFISPSSQIYKVDLDSKIHPVHIRYQEMYLEIKLISVIVTITYRVPIGQGKILVRTMYPKCLKT